MEDKEKLNETEIISSNEYIIETINIENINVPLKIRKNIESNINEYLEHKTDTDITSFTKDKKFYNQVLDSWVKNYNFKINHVFDVVFTEIVNISDNYKIFLLYFIEQEDENIYIEIDVTFNVKIENINEIFLLIFKK